MLAWYMAAIANGAHKKVGVLPALALKALLRAPIGFVHRLVKYPNCPRILDFF